MLETWRAEDTAQPTYFYFDRLNYLWETDKLKGMTVIYDHKLYYVMDLCKDGVFEVVGLVREDPDIIIWVTTSDITLLEELRAAC